MRLLIWGCEGVGREIINILKGIEHPYQEIGYILDTPTSQTEILGFPIQGDRQLLDQVCPSHTHVFPAATSPATRRLFANYIQKKGFYIPSFIHPTATVRPEACLGTGLLAYAHAYIDNLTKIGDCVVVGTFTVIGHDAVIGNYCSLYTGSKALGYTRMDEGALLGANACLMSFKKMGAFSKASICSAVLEDVPAYATVQGNPAQIIKQYEGPPPVSLYSLANDGRDT